MAKKTRKPKWQYQLIDSHGDPCVDFKRLKSALSNKRMQDDIYTEIAPHRVYKLVTLEEVAVIRAAVAAVKSRGKDFRPGVKEWKRLVDAVEASRG